MEIKNGGPAFPESVAADMQDGLNYSRNKGMSLRDYFAATALRRWSVENEHSEDDIARWCYKMADAMLRAREGKS